MITLIIILFSTYCLGFFTCLIKTSSNEKIRWVDCLDPRKWISVVVGNSLMLLVPPHILEQMALRVYDPECKECVQNGKCFDCGCDMPAKAYDPNQVCSRGNWGKIIWDKRDFLHWKSQVSYKIKVEYEEDV